VGIDVGSGETGGCEKILAQGILGVEQRIFSISALRPPGAFAAQSLDRRQDHPFLVRARLLPGVSVEQAQVARCGMEFAL